ncbi:Alkaline phosphatase protein, partial [human gut metagenome]
MKQSTIALALLPLLFTPVTKARTPEMPVLENRAAQGDITAPGGARHLLAHIGVSDVAVGFV